MQYEVENKFSIANVADMVRRLEELGAVFRPAIEQVDTYFQHPVRVFAQTDEALRIRRIGTTNLITYKGPKIDQATKTRQEIELPLAAGAEHARQYSSLLQALGFQPVAEVRKQRRGGQLQFQQWEIELAVDEVDQLGAFVELEIVVDQALLAGAQQAIQQLAAALGLSQPERRSYLAMLLGEDN